MISIDDWSKGVQIAFTVIGGFVQVGTLFLLFRTNKKVEDVKHNTNGILAIHTAETKLAADARLTDVKESAVKEVEAAHAAGVNEGRDTGRAIAADLAQSRDS